MQVLRLKEFLIKANLSRREIYVSLNNSQLYYRSWEQGQCLPNENKDYRYVIFLNVIEMIYLDLKDYIKWRWED